MHGRMNDNIDWPLHRTARCSSRAPPAPKAGTQGGSEHALSRTVSHDDHSPLATDFGQRPCFRPHHRARSLGGLFAWSLSLTVPRSVCDTWRQQQRECNRPVSVPVERAIAYTRSRTPPAPPARILARTWDGTQVRRMESTGIRTCRGRRLRYTALAILAE
jgi:hypothetical protein